MHLTKKSSYGLIATIELASNGGNEPISARSIAEKYGLPVPFVEKIMGELRAARIVTSRKGRRGGYTLAVRPEDISVRQILEALGESLDLVRCVRPDEATCQLLTVCPGKDIWGAIDERFKELLNSLSLADLSC
ncbi:MAG TPA: Rrf2 family transcriptional regulator [Candidatus Acetothermia bacterium]|nr:Rrf2 family transcriptional regulator [Candidatus Bipolaricaulota bacterium]RLE40018.1 MAG: transcriptional regulator [Candidatus Acetothermia bacterium]RLF61661.1 MAG: transcriptional regulator [Thermoplasmata archaeon]HDJ29856.1 Rrf2 family transcriptional regulator [Candidatus Acetothermia bacterium]